MKTILFQGDSITDCGRIREESDSALTQFYKKLHKSTALGNGYPAKITAQLQKEFPGSYRYINRGVSGDTILNIYARIVRDIINIKPDYMSLLIGVNDVWRGIDNDYGTGKERFEKVYDIVLSELREELPDMKIMIMEPFLLEGTASVSTPERPDRYDIFKKGVDEAAETARKIAEKYDCKFIEIQKHLDEVAKVKGSSYLSADGVHPSDAGHELIKNEWLKAFNEIK